MAEIISYHPHIYLFLQAQEWMGWLGHIKKLMWEREKGESE